MAADDFITNLKENFRQGNIVTRLLYINVGAFLICSLVGIILMLFKAPFSPWICLLYTSPSPRDTR